MAAENGRSERHAPRAAEPRAREAQIASAPVTRGGSNDAPVARGDSSIGVSGIRLTRDEAFSLVRDAVAALATGDDAVPSERVRQKAFALLGRDSESLSERNFARILRDAHDGDVVDLRKRGDAFEVAMAATVASVADQLEVKEAQLKAAAAQEKAANTVAVPRGMGHRGAPARGGRGGFGAKAAGPPPNLLLGMVDETPAPSVDESAEKPGRRGRGRARKDDGADETAADDEKPARTRTPQAQEGQHDDVTHRPLPAGFYARETELVARELLGATLECTVRGIRCRARIVETEAYTGEEDLACHAAAGRTARTEILYGPPGRAYVYFVYGMHWCVNAVTRRAGLPSAVLIRAGEPLEGIAAMRRRRGVKRDGDLTNGPAKLCEALGITGPMHNGRFTADVGPADSSG